MEACEDKRVSIQKLELVFLTVETETTRAKLFCAAPQTMYITRQDNRQCFKLGGIQILTIKRERRIFTPLYSHAMA